MVSGFWNTTQFSLLHKFVFLEWSILFSTNLTVVELSNFCLLQTCKIAPNRYRELKHFPLCLYEETKQASMVKQTSKKCMHRFKILHMRGRKLFSSLCFPVSVRLLVGTVLSPVQLCKPGVCCVGRLASDQHCRKCPFSRDAEYWFVYALTRH